MEITIAGLNIPEKRNGGDVRCLKKFLVLLQRDWRKT